jgi:tetratricopeptide (TPR) repeat protein
MARHARKGLAALVLVGLALVAPLPAQTVKSPADMNGDELFAAWRTSGPSILTSAFPSAQRFEDFRKDFRKDTLGRWAKNVVEPDKAMFMLDIALVSQPRYRYWADYIRLGRDYLAQRKDPAGALPELDAFELLWNKTAVAFASGRKEPEVVEELIDVIRRRITPSSPPPPARPNLVAAPVLVDPWIALMQGYAQEAHVLLTPSTIAGRGRAAIEAYDKAIAFDTTRAEATVRKAWLLLQAGKTGEALEALNTFQEAWTNEGVLLYWSRLLRAKALAALDRHDEAIRMYGTALELMPSAQSPRVGIMFVEFNRGRGEHAEAIARDLRTAADPVNDPWWIYPHGDLRFFPQREKALRAMVKK